MLALAGLFTAVQAVWIGNPVAFANFDAAPLVRPLVLVHMLELDAQDVEAQTGGPSTACAARTLEAQVAVRVVVMRFVGGIAHVLIKEIPERAGYILQLLLFVEVASGRNDFERFGIGLLELRLGHVLAIVAVALELGHLDRLELALLDGDLEDMLHVVFAGQGHGGIACFEHGEREDAVFELEFYARFAVALLGDFVGELSLAYLVDVSGDFNRFCLALCAARGVRVALVSCGASRYVCCAIVLAEVTICCGGRGGRQS